MDSNLNHTSDPLGLAAQADLRQGGEFQQTGHTNHHGEVNVALMDGSAQFVDDQISRAIWRNMSTHEGGESDHEQ